MSAAQSTDSILHRLEVVGDHLASIRDLAGSIKDRRAARAIEREAAAAIAALGVGGVGDGKATPAVAVGAAVGRRPRDGSSCGDGLTDQHFVVSAYPSAGSPY